MDEIRGAGENESGLADLEVLDVHKRISWAGLGRGSM